MNIRFAIKSALSGAEKEGDVTVRFTGKSTEPVFKTSERECKAIGLEPNGDKKLLFTTGLDENLVKFYKWYSEEEKEQVKKQIQALKPLISDYYGGPLMIDPTNKFFWKGEREVSRFSMNNSKEDTFYDTSNPPHALLYLSIIAGAFSDTIAPTKEWAERTEAYYYLALETEDNTSDEDLSAVRRSDAHALLGEIRKEESSDALFILAWCLQYETNAYGAYSRSTPVKDLVSYHIKYIDGKLVTKKKRDTAKVFIDYVDKWKGQQTRPLLYTEAYVKAGEYYSFLQQREQRFTTENGTILGATVEEAVETLMKPKFSKELTRLRELVENKWKE